VNTFEGQRKNRLMPGLHRHRLADAPQRIDARHAALSHGADIHNYLRRRAGQDVADDLLAEVWVRAFAEQSSFDPRRGDIRPWLFGVARNVLREYWRSFGRTIPPLERAISDPWSDVDDRLDHAALCDELVRALDQLSLEEREVLLLFAWEQMSQREIASVLAIPDGTVRSRLHRARRSMRGLISVGLLNPVLASREGC
jgi:RNA polymerase sigma factor (sigma-70 family)